MFQKLHRQFALFSIVITSAILLTMTLACLFIAESSVRKNSYAAFTNNSRTLVTQLESQTTVSHRFLQNAMETHDFRIKILDNGKELYFFQLGNRAKEDAETTAAFQKASEISAETYHLDPMNFASSRKLTQTAEFQFPGYYAATALIPRENGSLSLIVLCPMTALKHQILTQRIAFGVAALVSAAALAVFAWFFTKRMLRPLEQSRKEQTAFIAAASHELRSPLAVIQSSLSAIPDAPAEKARQFLHISLKECSRMSRLIQDMLSLSRADNHTWVLNTAPCEIDTLLLDTFEKYEGIARKQHRELRAELPEEELPVCLCDGEKISQVLGILIENGISYVPEGGIIRLSARAEKSSLLLSVRDNGPGIPDSEKEAVFRRFYRTDTSRNDKNHFGLGLCIAKEIVELHHGSICIQDAPGGGADFQIRLPLSKFGA